MVGLFFTQSFQDKECEPAVVSFLKNLLSNYSVNYKLHGRAHLGKVTHFTDKNAEV